MPGLHPPAAPGTARRRRRARGHRARHRPPTHHRRRPRTGATAPRPGPSRHRPRDRRPAAATRSARPPQRSPGTTTWSWSSAPPAPARPPPSPGPSIPSSLDGPPGDRARPIRQGRRRARPRSRLPDRDARQAPPDHRSRRTVTAGAAGTTVILDEAGHGPHRRPRPARRPRRRHRLAARRVGDPAQLPAVGRGGMFAHWCDTLPTHHLDQVHRFTEAWEADASLAASPRRPRAPPTVRRPRPAPLRPPGAGRRARSPASTTRHVDERARPWPSPPAAPRRPAPSTVEIQRRADRRRPGVPAGRRHPARVGDQIATRRNDPTLTHRPTASGPQPPHLDRHRRRPRRRPHRHRPRPGHRPAPRRVRRRDTSSSAGPSPATAPKAPPPTTASPSSNPPAAEPASTSA